MIFYIDTSTPYLYTALYNNGKIINERTKYLAKDLSRYTLD